MAILAVLWPFLRIEIHQLVQKNHDVEQSFIGMRNLP
jgi:hypothetical protein